MTQTYKIEKKTPNGQWHTINNSLDADTAVETLTDIIFSYDSMAEYLADRDETKDMFADQLDADNYVSTSVDDGVNGERGDDICYRIVAEEA